MMESMFRWLLVLIVLAAVTAGGLYYVAGRSAPPVLTITKPDAVVGQRGELIVAAVAPHDTLTALTAVLEQDGQTYPLFALDAPGSATLKQTAPDRLEISRPIGKADIPTLKQGPARIVVSATRKSFLNLRQVSASTSKDFAVRLEPPRIAVLSTHHYVNHGGTEMVVYRVTPSDVTSGVRVGDTEYRGVPVPGTEAATSGLRLAFFALLYDQDLNTPITAFARDAAGNQATAMFIDKVFEKPMKRSRIEIDDRFLQRVVPEILAHSPELTPAPPPNDLVAGFLAVNGELRRLNADKIAKLTGTPSPAILFKGPFVQLGNSKVEANFADHRTYLYKGKDIDQQVHLGFDLAVTARVPVLAANDGIVVNADWLGIYGNCVIIDHGAGVASLYGHLSSIDVKVGDHVTKSQVLGRSGMTGLAGGDHLHFTMLVDGHPVNPVEWWDPHWMQDRVERKLQESGVTALAATR
jgi:murein DD-endopeptidase MepM/ murein hydrolase activator NlpD